MRITQITISKGITINLGDFNSARSDVGLTADLDQGEDHEEVFALLDAQVQEWLRTATSKIKGVRFDK